VPRIPEYLAANESARSWTATLPSIIDELRGRWALTVGEPYEPGGRCSWVAPARTAAGEAVVLKIGWRHPEAEHEADGLRIWAGEGAVRLYDTHTTADTAALLIERCAPGTPLGHTLPEPEQDVIIAKLLRRLWIEPPAGHGIRPLSQMCDMWAGSVERSDSPGGLDPGIARAGVALFRELPRTADRAVLLCTDLHAENVLAAQRESWLTIDPKPYFGDPAYDVLQHVFNCETRLLTDPVGLADRMAGLLDLDAERVRRWLFARCVVESTGCGRMSYLAHVLLDTI
jgi:streptomycin 6-kinase